MSEINAELKAAQQRIQVLERNLRDAEEANRRLAKQVIKADQCVSDLNGEVLRLGLQLKHHLQLQAERDAMASDVHSARLFLREKDGLLREFHAVRKERDTLAARLAEMEGQEPVGEVKHLHELNDEWASELPIGTKLYARPVPAEPANAPLLEARLLEAIKRLSFCAQTTGGTAGRDEELCAAIGEAEKVIAAAESAPKVELLSRGEINRILWRDSRGHPGIGTPIVDKVEFARAIETAVLAKNGIEVAE